MCVCVCVWKILQLFVYAWIISPDFVFSLRSLSLHIFVVFFSLHSQSDNTVMAIIVIRQSTLCRQISAFRPGGKTRTNGGRYKRRSRKKRRKWRWRLRGNQRWREWRHKARWLGCSERKWKPRFDREKTWCPVGGAGCQRCIWRDVGGGSSSSDSSSSMAEQVHAHAVAAFGQF